MVSENGYCGDSVRTPTPGRPNQEPTPDPAKAVVISEVMYSLPHVIVVEVHQVRADSNDLAFGVQLADAPSINQNAYPSDKLDKGLRITKLMYHPKSPSAPEYVELQIMGDQPLDLSGVRLSESIDFTFHAGTNLATQQYSVVTENALLFR